MPGDLSWLDVDDLRFGDVPTWTAAIFAGLAALFAGRAWTQERGRDQRAQERDQREQASKIAAWALDRRGDDERVALRNASDLPVHVVQIFSYKSQGYRVGRPSMWVNGARFAVGTLGPSAGPPRFYGTHRYEPEVTYQYAIQFVDCAGVLWHRETNGVLAKGPFPYADRFPDAGLMPVAQE